MSAAITRRLRGLVVVAVSDHNELLELLVALFQTCGATVCAYASAQHAAYDVQQGTVVPNVLVLDSATKDITAPLLVELDSKRLTLVAFTVREPDGPLGVWWVQRLQAPYLHSTELDVVCDTVQAAIVSR
jgi:hypothetical protein